MAYDPQPSLTAGLLTRSWKNPESWCAVRIELLPVLSGRQPAPKMLAVIADPVFDRTDARFKTVAPAAGRHTGPPLHQ